MPEYGGLTETESQIDSPRLIDSEYTSDFINYQKPLEWESQWWAKTVGLDFSAGSLGGKEFLVDQKFRLSAILTEKLKFSFFWISDRDYDEDFTHQVLELSYLVNAKYGIAAYTSVSREKAEDDVGLALLHFRPATVSRLYLSLLDFQRNERNRATDRFRDGKGPLAIGFVQRRNERDSFHVRAWQEWSWRLEPKVHWEFPAESKDYEFQRQSVQLRSFQRHEDGRTMAWRLNWNDKTESESVAATIVTGRRQRAWAQVETGQHFGKGSLRYGLHHLWRRFTGTDQHAEFRDWMPFLWWEGPERHTDFGARQWQVGYDVVLGWTEDDTHEFQNEHRLNGIHRWRFADSGAIDAILTFDLDRFSTGETWEGGSVRLVWSL